MEPTNLEALTQARAACFVAATDQIVALVTDHTKDMDEVIKMMLDERRRIHSQFTHRINVYKATKTQ